MNQGDGADKLHIAGCEGSGEDPRHEQGLHEKRGVKRCPRAMTCERWQDGADDGCKQWHTRSLLLGVCDGPGGSDLSISIFAFFCISRLVMSLLQTHLCWIGRCRCLPPFAPACFRLPSLPLPSSPSLSISACICILSLRPDKLAS